MGCIFRHWSSIFDHIARGWLQSERFKGEVIGKSVVVHKSNLASLTLEGSCGIDIKTTVEDAPIIASQLTTILSGFTIYVSASVFILIYINNKKLAEKNKKS